MGTEDPKLRSKELARILAIPEQDLSGEGEALAEKWTKLLRRHDSAPSLRPVQGLILEAAYQQAQRGEWLDPDGNVAVGGVIGNVAVGGGKTLTFLLIPRAIEHALGHAVKSTYLFPPKLRSTVEDERWKWSKHYKLARPQLIAYSQLSQPGSSALLRQLEPGVIMADECQNLRNFTAARTKRFVRYMVNHPTCRFVGLTGTLTKGSLLDYAHQFELALRDGSPAPLDEDIQKMWASVVDHKGEPDAIALSAMAPLVATYNRNIQLPPYTEDPAREERRQAFYHRLRTTPGVILTTGSSCDADIVMEGLRFDVSDELHLALSNLDTAWVLPDETEVIDTLHMDRARQELSLGFYYVWDWPGEPDEAWVEARRGWAREVRAFLQYRSREGLDSPALVEGWVETNPGLARQVAPTLVPALEAWYEQKNKAPPPTKPVWIDKTPIHQAVAWAYQQLAEGEDRVFLWFRTRAVAAALEEMGIPCLFGVDPDPSSPIQGLSTAVYHAGWNLQAWKTQLVLEPDANPVTWEQQLGRTHRQGQEAGVIRCDVLQHLWPLRYKVGEAINRARTVQSTMHQPQKLLMASYKNIGPPGVV